jgi:hypothetical protein
MDAAVLLIVGLLLVAFGGWRVMAGLYEMEMIVVRVPGHDLFTRFVPRWMRASDELEGLSDLIGSLLFIAFGVYAASAA